MLDQPISLDAANDFTLRGDFSKAEEIYQALLGDDPLNSGVLSHYGTLCMKMHRPELAVDYFSKALVNNPDVTNILENLSRAHYSKGSIKPAIACISRAMSLEPDCARLRDLKNLYQHQPCTHVANALQGCHAPERQVFMSATVDLLNNIPAPLRILEIGSFMGCSALTWAKAADQLYGHKCSIMCIDPWGDVGADYYTKSIENSLDNDATYNIFRHNISLVPDNVTVDHIRATSQSVLPSLRKNHFDIIYIDGCHYFEETLSDLKEAHHLLKSGGIMCGDDLELQAMECDRDFATLNVRNDWVADPKTGQSFHPGVTLAVDAFFSEVSVYRGFWAMRKAETGYDTVSFKNATGVLPTHWPAEYIEAIKKYFAASNDLGALRNQ